MLFFGGVGYFESGGAGSSDDADGGQQHGDGDCRIGI